MNLIGKLKINPSDKISDDSRISIGFECLDREMFDPEQCYDKLAAAGIKHARCQTGWCRCEKEKGVYDFAWLDSIVDNLLHRGIKPWFNVGYGNKIYMPDATTPEAVGCVPTLYGSEVLEAWKNYIYELTVRYKNRVEYFEIWNEADISGFWFPGKSDGKQYAELVNITGEIIQKVHPIAKIGACAASAIPISDCRSDFMWDFISNVRKLEFFSLHRYAMNPEMNYFAAVNQLKKTFEYFGMSDIELWNGECGYPSWLPDNHYMRPKKSNSSEHQQAVAALRYYFLDAFAGLTRTSFFQAADMKNTYATAEGVRYKRIPEHGILKGGTYTTKKVYEAFSYMAQIFNGKVKPCDDFITVSTQAMCMAFERDGKTFYSYYIPYYCEDETPVSIDSVSVMINRIGKRNEFKNPVLVDMLDGNVYEINVEKSIRNNIAVKYSGLNIGDYPMVICDKSFIEIEV